MRDIDLQWFTSVVNGKLVVSQNAQADVSFSADASDLLMIAARKQDPDTLFFQRRLVIEGDTELGRRPPDADIPLQFLKESETRDQVGIVVMVLSQLRTLTVVNPISITAPSAPYFGISSQSPSFRPGIRL